MFRALARARSSEGDLLERYAAFEEVFALSGGASARILAASAALTRGELVEWAEQILREARAAEPERPEVFVWLGVAALRRSAPRAEVDQAWLRALRLDPGYQLPSSLLDSYRERYGAAFAPR